MTQLSFDLPLRSAHGRADFFVSDANAMALAMLDRPDHWPQGKLIILGPQGSGKSHLLDIWCNDHAGQTWDINDDQLPPDGAHIAVDDVDQWAGQPDAETKLFHIHNHILATKGRLLLALSHPVGAAGFVLPDLISRLTATTATHIDQPDDVLVRAMILKHFMDRQLSPSPQVQQAIAKHVDRSFPAIAHAVDTLDRRAMALGQKITPKMVTTFFAEDSSI